MSLELAEALELLVHRPGSRQLHAAIAESYSFQCDFPIGPEDHVTRVAQCARGAGVVVLIDYSRQTPCSDPGQWGHLFDEVDPTIDGVSQMARNIVAHYQACAAELPSSSRDDISLRWVEAILDTDQQRHRAPLDTERPLSERVQGCCRDHTLLAVSALRHHGVAARSRVGFAGYLSGLDWHCDHVVAEVWMGGRWRRFDPEFGAPLDHLADPTDIPDGTDAPFLTAARVWLAHRAGLLDVNRFGAAEGHVIAGEWFVYRCVVTELAHRFGDELLLWDTWGAMSGHLERTPPSDRALVDEVARLLVRADDGDRQAEHQLLARYREDPRLCPGDQIRSFSPHGGVTAVDLTERKTTKFG